MSDPGRQITIKREGETSSVGETLELDGVVYRVVGIDASTPVTDASMDLDAERGDVIVTYQLEYVGPARGGGVATGSVFKGGPWDGTGATAAQVREHMITVDEGDQRGRYLRDRESNFTWWPSSAKS